jgi:hypothetical protein
MHQVFDGTCHGTPQAALKYVENSVGEDLDEMLKWLIENRKQTRNVILHMMANPGRYIEILSRLTKYDESEKE